MLCHAQAGAPVNDPLNAFSTSHVWRENMSSREVPADDNVTVSREELIDLLNEDLAREYQAIISYVIYSQVLKGAPYMKVAAELERHAGEELSHALLISKQIDYLGGMPITTPKEVRTSEKAEEMLRFDLDNETETIQHYRQRVRQCEALGEFALAERLREILVQEQDHQMELATALGIDVPRADSKVVAAASRKSGESGRRAAVATASK
jgi:bacterioferritin